MIRIALVLLALTVPALAQNADDDDRIMPVPALRAQVTVESDIVRIGDLVDNAGTAAGVAIFRAPDLGHTGRVPVARILDALRAQQMSGVDSNGLTEIAVTRASRTVSSTDIEARVAATLAGQYVASDPKNLKVTIERDRRSLQIDAAARGELEAIRVTFDPRNGRFDISFALQGSNLTAANPLRVTGSVQEIVEAASVVRPLNRGDVLRAADVVIEKRPKYEAGNEPFLVASEAIGQAARRPVRPGQPLRAADVMKPELVQRNEAVTIVFEAPGMRLSLRGKAMDGGSEGEVINVQNLQTKRTIQAVVSGPAIVTVEGGFSRVAARLSGAGRAQ